MFLLITPEVSTGDIVQGAAVFLSIVGSAIAFLMSRHRDRKLRAIEHITKTWEMWTEDMDKAYDLILSEEFKCDGEKGYWNNDDGNLFTLLFFLEIICLMKKSRIISKRELALYAYDIVTVHGNEEVGKYIFKTEKELSGKGRWIRMFVQSRAIYQDLTGKEDAATQEAKRQPALQSS
jgi:hypothetical protein